MTTRQAEALEWLRSVGKSTVRLARKNGYAQRTLDALVSQGLVTREYVPRTFGGPFPVYRVASDA